MSTNDNSHDKHFFDTFMLVLGLLIGVAVVLIFLSRSIATSTQHVVVAEDKGVIQAANDRLSPFGQVAISGADNSALDLPKADAKKVEMVDVSGAQAFSMACTACHGLGIAGAPKMGDKAAWAPRLAQGLPTLYKHALEGFTGKAGFMPSKGGRADFSEKSVTAAVDYMTNASK